MTLTYQSRELARVFEITEVHELDLETCRKLHTELTLAIQGMDDVIKEGLRLEAEAGIPCDRDWLHRTRKKRRVSIGFASETKRRLFKLEGIDGMEMQRRRDLADAQRERFLRLKQARMRAALIEELGPGVYEEIENEAHEGAEEEFKAWLEENRYEQLYVT